MSAKTEALTELIEPVVESFELKLWGFQYMAQGGHSLLRIFIDSENGINVDDCAKVSRQLSAVLDVEDPISGKYTLEVSSPGLDRPLFKIEQYSVYIGSTIKVKLSRAIEGQKKFKAALVAVDEVQQSIEIELNGESISIDFINIDKASLVGNVG